ncbi:hypothetical protein CVT24_008256 [Panaeolus cyanescens]|uniref:Uncharacterized protein n=1 Tax=Panaeolus cyanescens TaxID=181874 RepID=A0A409VF89_9AGAR|nr:hypothetical protein CVT24_008256 [Panaeolus cyanescens]
MFRGKGGPSEVALFIEPSTFRDVYGLQPTQVQRRPSEPSTHHGLDPAQQDHHHHYHHDSTGRFHVTSKAQQQHKEALRLALGTILTAKRPPVSPNSRPTSGSASPAHPFVHTPGTSTPVGTPPSILYSTALGPMSSEYLHPHGHHPYGHSHHGHPLPPSRLGRSTPGSHSPLESSTPSSAQASPALPQSPHPEPLSPLLNVPEMDPPLPPPATQSSQVASPSRPVRPPISPLQPNHGAAGKEGITSTMSSPSDVPCVKAYDAQGRPVQQKAKFLQTLQSKSAWDALIHGSFS